MNQNLMDKVIANFRKNIGWKVFRIKTENEMHSDKIDGQIQINMDQGAIHLIYEIKKSVIPSSIPSIKRTFESMNFQRYSAQGAILLANYISTKARKMLHLNNIYYADTAGNIFLKSKDIHLYIETGQSDRSALTSQGGRAFTKAGLKVLYQFFRSENRIDLNDDLEFDAEYELKAELNSSYKHIASQASVSKDTVSKVIQDLLEQGYILRKNSNEYAWKEKKVVFERWVNRINEIVRPSLEQRKYRLIGDDIVHETKPLGYQLGGYHGAHGWLNLKPFQQIINAPYLIYSHKPFTHLVQDLKVVPDPNGNVTVLKAFWKDDSNISPSADFPILYADLLSSADSRMLEVAQLIYKNFIDDHL